MAQVAEVPNRQRINVGLCVYGVSYTTGFVGRDTPRANPWPLSYLDLLDLAARLGLASVEVPRAMLPDSAPGTLEALRTRAEELGLRLVVAGGRVSAEALTQDMTFAQAVGAQVVRCTLSDVLCGDRRPVGGLEGWRRLLAEAATILRKMAPVAEGMDLRLGIENHQDATSEDLVWLCEKVGSPSVGVTLDTGNALAVTEDPVLFALHVLPHIVNVHLKDYRVFRTPVGYRLVHCPIGAGVVDFEALFALLKNRPEVCRNLEMAALTERHVRLLEDDYWEGYPPRDVRSVLPLLRLWREREEHGEWRTPWETGDEDQLVAWEMDRLEESVVRLSRILGERDAATPDCAPSQVCDSASP